jgi:excisionase family DNA binding protein
MSAPDPAPDPSDNSSRLLTADDVAERWQVSRSQVYGLVRAGTIPTVAIGRYYRFRLDALVEWEQSGGTRASFPDRGV